jgi:hypothetical protein
MPTSTQNFQNHAQFVPLYHYVTFPLLLLNLIVAAYQTWQHPGLLTAWAIAMAVALILVTFFARFFALKAQDRVIRLEERLRLRELLPASRHAEIATFSTDQLIGLRFASDEELPALAASVLRDNIQDRTAIKKMVKSWRADDCRV